MYRKYGTNTGHIENMGHTGQLRTVWILTGYGGYKL